MFEECFKFFSRNFQKSFKQVSRGVQIGFKEVSRCFKVFHGNLKNVSMSLILRLQTVLRSFKGVSGKFQGCCKSVSR